MKVEGSLVEINNKQNPQLLLVNKGKVKLIKYQELFNETAVNKGVKKTLREFVIH
ncbi:MAG: hypothetical protein J5I91_02315 [Bacteroidetes bacterium]|nr:hypothetical protein [Bacteroidota bacterium]